VIILGVFTEHDAGAALFDDYRMLAAVALERMTRIKCDGGRFPSEAVDECLAAAGLTRADVGVLVLPRMSFPSRYFRGFAWWDAPAPRPRPHRSVLRQMMFQRTNPAEFFDGNQFARDHGFNSDTRVSFYNHHLAHALCALFHTNWDDAVLYTADGGGDRVFYSARELAGGVLHDRFGDEAASTALMRMQRASGSLAQLYAMTTEALGFVPLRHEGKVLGLAACGKARFADWFRSAFSVDDNGAITGRRSRARVRRELARLAAGEPREDIAASVQAAVEDHGLLAVRNILRRSKSRRMGVAGGLFANVRLNQRIAEECEVDELLVYPAMSDQGEAAGGVLQFLLERDGLAVWLDHRQRLNDVYLGRDYDASADAAFRNAGALASDSGDSAKAAARMIADGAAVGTYLGRMEYGPRALGARSIMARATDRSINDSLNKRLSRTEFMPFAPVVRAERFDEVFDLPPSLRHSANFMTTTCNVRSKWRDRIPAVVHVDGTARPQVIHRDQNPLYYDILMEYEALTNLPALINTSFNAHEEPIINTPQECAAALLADRVDAVVTQNRVWSVRDSSASDSKLL
jgi:carbamoyltransferase